MILANVDVYLGMPKGVFLQKLSKLYRLTNTENTYLVQEVTTPCNIVGTVTFVNDRVSFASKSWTQDDGTASAPDVASALFGILSYAEKQGWRISRYMTDTLHQPGIKLQVATIFVGSRRITITKSNGRVSNQDVSGVNVAEAIGAKN